jgi:hypothetical protein
MVYNKYTESRFGGNRHAYQVLQMCEKQTRRDTRRLANGLATLSIRPPPHGRKRFDGAMRPAPPFTKGEIMTITPKGMFRRDDFEIHMWRFEGWIKRAFARGTNVLDDMRAGLQFWNRFLLASSETWKRTLRLFWVCNGLKGDFEFFLKTGVRRLLGSAAHRDTFDIHKWFCDHPGINPPRFIRFTDGDDVRVIFWPEVPRLSAEHLKAGLEWVAINILKDDVTRLVWVEDCARIIADAIRWRPAGLQTIELPDGGGCPVAIVFPTAA